MATKAEKQNDLQAKITHQARQLNNRAKAVQEQLNLLQQQMTDLNMKGQGLVGESRDIAAKLEQLRELSPEAVEAASKE